MGLMACLSRRTFLSAAAVPLGACGRRKAEGFPGYAFVANSEGRAVAVVDLGAFATVRHLRLDGNPAALLSHPSQPLVYALAPGLGAVYEIRADELTLGRQAHCRGRVLQMAMTPAGDALWVLSAVSTDLLLIPTADLRPAARITLPGVPSDFDLSPDGLTAVVSFGQSGQVALVDLGARQVAWVTAIHGAAGVVRYRGDGRLLLAGHLGEPRLSALDAATGRLVVELPLAVEPENLCFKPDGGEMFITGPGMDAVVTVRPYQTEVASTTLAGHAPGPMAISSSPDYLFVTNPKSGGVTVIDIATQRVVAVVSVGNWPCAVVITPDNRYALVLNRGSGDIAVIRIASLTGRRRRFAPLFTMTPVGSGPVSAVVRAV